MRLINSVLVVMAATLILSGALLAYNASTTILDITMDSWVVSECKSSDRVAVGPMPPGGRDAVKILVDNRSDTTSVIDVIVLPAEPSEFSLLVEYMGDALPIPPLGIVEVGLIVTASDKAPDDGVVSLPIDVLCVREETP